MGQKLTGLDDFVIISKVMLFIITNSLLKSAARHEELILPLAIEWMNTHEVDVEFLASKHRRRLIKNAFWERLASMFICSMTNEHKTILHSF